MRRVFSLLVLLTLAVPASLALSGRGGVGNGESCAISCGHAAGEACCCSEKGGASVKRCDTERELFAPVLATKVVLSATVWGFQPPPQSGALESAGRCLPASVPQSPPDHVPLLLS